MVQRREQLGQWLSGKGERSLEIRLQETSKTFLYLFNRWFGARGSIIQDAIWSGLILSPIILVGIQIPVSLGVEAGGSFGLDIGRDTADLLILAILLAFGISFVVGIVSLNSSASTIGSGVVVAIFAIIFGVIFFVIFFGSITFIVIGSGSGSVRGISIVNVIVIFIGAAVATTREITTREGIGLGIGGGIGGGGIGIFIGIFIGDALIVGLGLGLGFAYLLSTFFLTKDTPITVHPLWAMGSSLAFIFIVSSVASLVRSDAATSFLDAIDKDGLKVLAFVAFNIFADGISLLETRWVLQRGSKAKVYQLVGLVVLDILLSAVIFLFLPLILGEITTFWDEVWLRGDRPWLGILFWSTFGTSALFYGFVIAVFLFLLPGHALATGFRKVIGSFSSIEDRPFTSIAYALCTLCILLAIVTLVTGVVTSPSSAVQP